jgi:hypothetical protein
MVARANFDTLRSLAFGGISAVYAAVGSPSANPIRGVCFTNNTEGDVVFAYDNTIVAGQVFVAAGSFKLWDVQSNMNAQFDDKFVLPIGTQFYVKQLEAPVSGSVYIEFLF